MAKIKRFGVLKMAGFLGIYSAFFGLIFSLIMWVLSLILSNIIPIGNLSILSFSWYYILILPLLYGVIGFISGFILTPIMNLVLKMTKGLDLDLELGGQMY